MPQEKSHKILITKATRLDDGYVFPGEIKTVKNLKLVGLRKAKIFDEKTMKSEAEQLAKAYKAKHSAPEPKK